MLTHIEEHLQNTYRCGQCSKGFKLFNDLSIHLRSHFKAKSSGPRAKKAAVTNLFIEQMTTTTDKMLTENTVSNGGDRAVAPTIGTEGKPRKVHQCEYCNAIFKRKHLLTTHRRIHTGDRPFKCSYCTKDFSRYYAMVAHERLHTGDRPYKCPHCDKSFTVSSHLNVHHKLKHVNLRPHKCELCEKAYRSPGELRIHMRSHTGDRPFSCEMCGKRYATQCSLTIHKKTHSPDKKPYVCELCGLSYKQPSSLGVHVRTSHSGDKEKRYQCEFCQKGFHIAGSLLRHRRIHTDERPYACDQCEKSFRESSALKAHKRRQHLGDRPYACDCCKKSFCTPTDLARHKKTHKGLMVLSSLAASIAESEIKVSKPGTKIQNEPPPVSVMVPVSISPTVAPATLEEMYATHHAQATAEIPLPQEITLPQEVSISREVTVSHEVPLPQDITDVAHEVPLAHEVQLTQDVTLSQPSIPLTNDSMVAAAVVVAEPQPSVISSAIGPVTFTLPVPSIHQTVNLDQPVTLPSEVALHLPPQMSVTLSTANSSPEPVSPTSQSVTLPQVVQSLT